MGNTAGEVSHALSIISGITFLIEALALIMSGVIGYRNGSTVRFLINTSYFFSFFHDNRFKIWYFRTIES